MIPLTSRPIPFTVVIPAKAGIHSSACAAIERRAPPGQPPAIDDSAAERWIPAFAGMTVGAGITVGEGVIVGAAAESVAP